ncbi:NADP-dependent oxidoreductase [Sphaerisporangium rufum]|uniref:NADP-dependent oxidoreductase n=1 Tax=Sphaerisporangium rufum TaxID=1381558 RepID=A0A919V481_9ACTN|nr:NADP-dependent oxidoreductase [Sphaerisporangium rufum]GII80893.1 NADP-dependent oxidoreductase [Sphaerisporangium rufum]
MSSSPSVSREVRLAARPDGLPGPEHFTIAETPLPEPGAGEVLVRNRFFHVAAALRTLIGGAEGMPLPPVNPGDPLPAATVGEVVAAPAGGELRPGDLVSHWLGWREYAAVPAEACVPLGDALPDPVAHLSQGATAYTALVTDARLRPGDTVFVTGGAGAVGSMAGQIARLLGAGRVIGSTGSADKAERLVAELGYDAVVVRGAGPVGEQLAKLAPDGVDVLLDNVGGEQLRAAVAAARPGARFVLVGALSGQLAPDGNGGTAPVELDTFPFIIKRIEMRGVSNPGDPATRAEWPARFGEWLRAGQITFPRVELAGIESAPAALPEVIGGRHLGTVVVRL